MKTGQSNAFRSLIFDYSRTESSYYPSHAYAISPSILRTEDGHIPINPASYYSPPNALELTWRSGTGGNWQAELFVERWRGRKPLVDGRYLSFWCRAREPIPAKQFPMMAVYFLGGGRTRPFRLTGLFDTVPSERWLQVVIPLEERTRGTAEYDFSRIAKIVFLQSIDDGQDHTLYIDEVRIFESRAQAKQLPAPDGLQAAGYGHHIDLSWQPLDQPQLLYYEIQRSREDEGFVPVGVQRPDFTRYVDYTGESGVSYRYRVSAVDQSYHHGPVSTIAEASTRQLSEDDLLTMLQEACFRYYWEAAHPDAGLALENIPGDENLVALGASGFGMMAWIAGTARGFITREQYVERLGKAVTFLEDADRFHGAWPHFLDGRDGKTVPHFGKYDNGGDILETSFMVQALLTTRQFLDSDHPREAALKRRITDLWESVEWSWYRGPDDSDFLYWHWSPDYDWHIEHPLIGWNETLITYLLAIASPTHPIPAELYHRGWASRSEAARLYRQNWGQTTAGDGYTNGNRYFDITLPVGVGSGGPLFFTHYPFLGFDPRGRRDRYTNYFENNRALTLINRAYCIANPRNCKGYGKDSWGLTASDDHTGYTPHEPSPRLDNGTLTPTAALSAFPYTPLESMAALKHLYYQLGDQIWDIYGFRDAFNPTENFVSSIFMGLDQAPIVVMVENYRTGLIWDLFMSNLEINTALENIGFIPES